jgi:uncharacterized membrane protein
MMEDRPRTTDDGRQTTGDVPSVVGRRSSVVVVVVAMLLFAIWFSAYSIRLHEAHRTHKADLGQIDLAIWNTAHGRFVQEIKDDQVSTRLTDHVEPIFLLVAPVFWLWDDVRALLILQALALALGAWPIYLLARRKIADCGLRTIVPGAQRSGIADSPNVQTSNVKRQSSIVAWGAVIFALAYLLTPALQAAAAAEFHALALAPVFIAWALWSVESRRWGQFAIAAILLMCMQEGMALLAALLGVYALVMVRRGVATQSRNTADERRGEIVGVVVALVGLVWFYVTTFVIIPHYAAQIYGLAQTPYAARYGALGDSFADVLKSFVTRPLVALSIAIEPARVRYLIGLLMPTAFLGLLGPEILLLSLPLLLANLFSSFPMQYFGELHYSAPLVPYFTLAAMIGLRRFEAQARPVGGPRASLALSLALVAAGALAAQVLAGYTVVGREFQRLAPGGWPQVTAHERLLDRFAAQVPRDAPLSASTDLYPHLSHRPRIYQFPWLGQAEWALVDVSGTTDRHPADIRREIGRLLETGWGVVDAADGYILLAKGRGGSDVPDAFYDFARAPAGRTPAAQPEFPLDITFGDRLKLLGYDLVDDAKWRRTALRFYWQALAPLGDDTAISVQAVAPDGSVVGEAATEAVPALLWNPPARWRPGETVVVETLPTFLPRAWAPLVGVTAGGKALPLQIGPGSQPPEAQTTAEGRVLLAPWERQGGWLGRFMEPREKYPLPARFAGDNWAVRLTDIAVRPSAAPGRDYPVVLRWAQEAGPAPRDYRVFVHLRDAAGKTVATGDATPTWFTPSPTNQWPSGLSTWDAHAIAIPADLTPGDYKLVIGWYDPETGKRLSASSADGNAEGNEYVIGRVAVYPLVGSRPDLACLMTPAACASQE